jgi:hypothetical protein
MLNINARMMIMAKGTAMVESARMTATYELISFSRLNMAYSEFATTKPGCVGYKAIRSDYYVFEVGFSGFADGILSGCLMWPAQAT